MKTATGIQPPLSPHPLLQVATAAAAQSISWRCDQLWNGIAAPFAGYVCQLENHLENRDGCSIST